MTPEVPGFCVTRHLQTARNAVVWVKNITESGRSCHLNIPRLRINSTSISMSSSSEEFKHYRENSKSDVSVGLNMVFHTKLYKLGKTCFRISRI